MWCVREVDRKLTVRRKRERQRSHDADPSQPDGGDWEPPAHSGWVRDDDGERREALNCPRHSNDQRRAPRVRRMELRPVLAANEGKQRIVHRLHEPANTRHAPRTCRMHY